MKMDIDVKVISLQLKEYDFDKKEKTTFSGK